MKLRAIYTSKSVLIPITASLAYEGLKTTPNAGFEQARFAAKEHLKKIFDAIACKARNFLCILGKQF